MSDLTSVILPAEIRISFREAATFLHVSVNTLTRWRLNGVRGVKLRCQRIGGRYYTSKQWLDEFVAALNHAKAPPVRRDDIEDRCRAAGV